jgi:hypothetical protein
MAREQVRITWTATCFILLLINISDYVPEAWAIQSHDLETASQKLRYYRPWESKYRTACNEKTTLLDAFLKFLASRSLHD